MEHRIRHDLGSLERAREVIERAYAEYRAKLAAHDPVLEWTNERAARIGFTVLSRTIWVDAELSPHDVILRSKLPLLFRPFQGRIVAVVEREVRGFVDRVQSEGGT